MPPVIFGPGFFLTARECAPKGSTTARKMQAALKQLAAEWPKLPGPDDGQRMVPPVAMCWMRRIEGTALCLCYMSGPAGITILAVKHVGE